MEFNTYIDGFFQARAVEYTGDRVSFEIVRFSDGSIYISVNGNVKCLNSKDAQSLIKMLRLDNPDDKD